MNIKFYFYILVLAFIAGCSTTPQVGKTEIEQEPIIIDPSPFLRMKWALNVPFNAYMDPADALKSDGGQIYYDGSAGAAGVLAQIFIHSAVANSQQKKRYENLQKDANTILAPYQNQLSKFSNSDLWQAVKSKDIGFKTYQEDNHTGVTVYEATPKFILSIDKTSMMVINKVDVFKSDDLENAIYTNSFVVISAPIQQDDIDTFWADQTSNHFIEIGASIFADSIELAEKDFNKELELTNKQKTFRYLLGKKKMYEHGQLIKDNCSNIIMKNLRGYIYKIPPQNVSTHCDDSTVTN